MASITLPNLGNTLGTGNIIGSFDNVVMNLEDRMVSLTQSFEPLLKFNRENNDYFRDILNAQQTNTYSINGNPSTSNDDISYYLKGIEEETRRQTGILDEIWAKIPNIADTIAQGNQQQKDEDERKRKEDDEKKRREDEERREQENRNKLKPPGEKPGYFETLMTPLAIGSALSGGKGFIETIFDPKVLATLFMAKYGSRLLSGLAGVLFTPMTAAIAAIGYGIYDSITDSSFIGKLTDTSAVAGGLTNFFIGDGSGTLLNTLTTAGTWAGMGALAGAAFGPIGMLAGAIIGGSLGAAAAWFADANVVNMVADNLQRAMDGVVAAFGVTLGPAFNMEASAFRDYFNEQLNSNRAAVDRSIQELDTNTQEVNRLRRELTEAEKSGDAARIASIQQNLDSALAAGQALQANLDREKAKMESNKNNLSLFNSDSYWENLKGAIQTQILDPLYYDVNMLNGATLQDMDLWTRETVNGISSGFKRILNTITTDIMSSLDSVNTFYALLDVSGESQRVQKELLQGKINEINASINEKQAALVASSDEITSLESQLFEARQSGNTALAKQLEYNLTTAKQRRDSIIGEIDAEKARLANAEENLEFFNFDSYFEALGNFINDTVIAPFLDSNAFNGVTVRDMGEAIANFTSDLISGTGEIFKKIGQWFVDKAQEIANNVVSAVTFGIFEDDRAATMQELERLDGTPQTPRRPIPGMDMSQDEIDDIVRRARANDGRLGNLSDNFTDRTYEIVPTKADTVSGMTGQIRSQERAAALAPPPPIVNAARQNINNINTSNSNIYTAPISTLDIGLGGHIRGY